MNKLVIGAVVVLMLIAAILIATNTKRTAVESTPNTMPNDMPRMNSNAPATSEGELDLSGIHIMADGAVMLGDGTVLPDASVTATGMILLPDGREVVPMMDMR